MSSPTVTLTCKPRSPEAMAEVCEVLIDPEHNPLYQRSDITGDGKDETFCNWVVHDATALLGCPVPKVLAREQIAWLRGEGSATHGWRKVEPGPAMAEAARGCPVVVGWVNPEQAKDAAGALRFDGNGKPIWKPSHVAMVRKPPPGMAGVWITQAGARNLNLAKLNDGFGHLAPLDFFVHA